GQWEPIAVSVIPDRRFTEEVKPCGMDHFRGAQLGIRFEEDRRTEYPFERRDQPSILFSAPSAIRTFPASRLRIENGWFGFVGGRLKWPGISARCDPDRTAARIPDVRSLGVQTVRCAARIGVGRQEGDEAEDRIEQTDGN